MSYVTRLLDPLTRFQLRVYPHGDCWRWGGFLNPAGYGVFRYNGDQLLAHRYAYEMAIGPIPAGLTLDHLCRNRWCVRPSHLLPMSSQENTRRGDVGKWARQKTHCPHGHGYTPENTRWYKGERSCLTCRRRQDRESQARRRARCRAA
jgi:hypothetical protein